MAKIRHIAITAEDPFVTAELFKSALGLEEISRGDSELAREVYLTDGYINLDRLLEAHPGDAQPVSRRLRARPLRSPRRRPRGRRGARTQGGRRFPATAAGGFVEAEREHHLLREEAEPRRRQVRPLGTRMAGDAAKVALEATGVRKSFSKDGRSLSVLDVERFTVQDGEFVTVIGPSGCGKSTLLHIMGGFIQ